MRKEDGGRLLVALCALAVCLGCPETPPLEKFGINGGAVTLEPKVNAGSGAPEISWKKGKDLVAELDPELWIAPRFRGSVELVSATGSLRFIKLQQNYSGRYSAEVVVGGEIQCTLFSLQILEPPTPPQLNCTAVGDSIQVSCEPDALYEAPGINQTFRWKYQESNKQIPGNSSEILLEKDVDFSESVTCTIHVLDASSSSSIRLRDCAPPGAVPQIRDRAWLLFPFVVLLAAGMVFYLWKRGCFNFKGKGKLNFKRKGKSQDCEGKADAAEAPPEAQCLREERSGNVEENSSKGPSDPGT